MKCTDCQLALNDYVDGEAAPGLVTEIEAHLAGCPACRAQLDSLRTLLARAEKLPHELRPENDLWPGIEARLESAEVRAVPPRASRIRRFPVVWLATAAAILLLLGGGIVAWQRYRQVPAFAVTRVEGVPRIGSRVFSDSSQLRVGQWLETDARSSARIEVATIGRVTVEPNSRLRLVTTSPTEHRLELARGRLEAFVVAPPRLFVVETPAATAIDLGCAYTIAVDDRGGGMLHVTSGYVALARGDTEVIVGAGMMCAMRSGLGAGTPFGDDAPEGLRAALARLDFETLAALPEVLAAARPQADALTLWYLFSRVTGTQRGAIFDALAAAEAPPAGVTRAGIIAGDQAMLDRWGQHLGDRRELWNVVKVKKG
jgi:hypothetical protein